VHTRFDNRSLFAVTVLLLIESAAPGFGKSIEIKCEFNDNGKMPSSIRVKVEVFEGEQRIGFGTDATQPRFIKCTASPSDAATRLILKFSTTKMDEWNADPSDSSIGNQSISVGPVLIFHRSSVLNIALDKAEGASLVNLPAAKEALKKAEPLLQDSAEKVRFARAQNKILELESTPSPSRQAAFEKALVDVDRSDLKKTQQVALVREEFDLLKDSVAETAGETGMAEKIVSSDTPLESGKTPKEELAKIALRAADATGKPSLKKASKNIEAGSAKAARDVARSINRSLGF
jgi:hypothetical protein